MQTFLPSEDFVTTAKCLDWRRLGKQRVETLQILNALTGVSRGWGNHPITRMWAGYESALLLYGVTICSEWLARGYNDTCLGKMSALLEFDPSPPMPSWMGLPKLHLSHQSNLVRKDPGFYGPKFPFIPSNLDYVWPV
ncbi:MSMEG_6728 family protein [Streptomyces sp. NPDC002248]